MSRPPMDDHFPGEVLGILDRNKDSGITAKNICAELNRPSPRVNGELNRLIEMRKCRKQKIGRAVLYYPDDRPSFEPEQPFVPLKPQKMTTIPVRSGGVVMPVFYGDKPVWLTGN